MASKTFFFWYNLFVLFAKLVLCQFEPTVDWREICENKYHILPGRGWDALTSRNSRQVIQLGNCIQRFLAPENVVMTPVDEIYFRVDILGYKPNVFYPVTALNMTLWPHDFKLIDGFYIKAYENIQRRKVEERLATVRNLVRKVNFRVDLNPQSQIHPIFEKRIMDVVDALKSSKGGGLSLANYLINMIIRDYGTHYTVRVDTGAIFIRQDYVSYDFIKKNEKSLKNILKASNSLFLKECKFASEDSNNSTNENSAETDTGKTKPANTDQSTKRIITNENSGETNTGETKPVNTDQTTEHIIIDETMPNYYTDVESRSTDTDSFDPSTYQKEIMGRSSKIIGGDIIDVCSSSKEWLDSVNKNMEIVDRLGPLLSSVVVPRNFPLVDPNYIAYVNELLYKAIGRYYEMNTHAGCMDLDSFNFKSEANVDDGSCVPKNGSAEKIRFKGSVLRLPPYERDPPIYIDTPNNARSNFNSHIYAVTLYFVLKMVI